MDWSYVAGYFDGEGHVSMHAQTNRRTSKIRGLSWYNTHFESLEAMQTFMGCGNIRRQNKLNRKIPLYILAITRRKDLIYVLDHLIPLLIVKRTQAEALRVEVEMMRDQSPNHGIAVVTTTEQYIQWYHGDGKSYAEIGRLLGIGGSAIAREFKLRGIPRRPAGGSHLKGVAKSEETKQRMKASRRKMWEDPEFRARQLENLKLGRKQKRTLTAPGA